MNIQGSQEQLTQQVNDDKDTARTRRNQLEWRKYFDWGVAPTQRMGKNRQNAKPTDQAWRNRAPRYLENRGGVACAWPK